MTRRMSVKNESHARINNTLLIHFVGLSLVVMAGIAAGE